MILNIILGLHAFISFVGLGFAFYRWFTHPLREYLEVKSTFFAKAGMLSFLVLLYRLGV
jgi:hypothetical protein